ncbi:MAG: TonB-dependent receptor [Methylohalobius sp.]|nr:TonB-dependent receptor [Methylohalobius sp.]
MRSSFILASCLAFSCLAEEPTLLDTLTVTATRREVPMRDLASSLTVLTEADFKARGVYTVAEALRTVPGLDVVRLGPLGQQTSVFVRGTESRHVLVLIDGVEANDPSNPGGLFDFAHLTVDDIERVEILRGPQSSLYGSDAIGGVIQVFTKRGEGKPKTSLSAEGGSFGTYRLIGQGGGQWDSLRYSLSASQLKSHGFSAADRHLAGNREDDGYRNTTVSARLNFEPSQIFALSGTTRYSRAEADTDNCGGARCDDPNARSFSDQVFSSLNGKLTLLDGVWEPRLQLAHTFIDRNFQNPQDLATPFAFFSRFQGEKLRLDWQNTFHLWPEDDLIVGFADELEILRSDQNPRRGQSTRQYYLENRIKWLNRLITSAGLRQEDPKHFGDKLTWRVTQAVQIPETGSKLRASYAKGFKAPTLYQLFAPDTGFGPVGNPSLKPETSRGWEIGIDQSFWDERILLGATYFRNDFRNLIDFVFGQGYLNRAFAESEGVEVYAEAKPLDFLTLRGSYTYTRTEDQNRKRLLRRPSHKGSFDADFKLWEGAHLHLNVLAVGTRDDLDFNAFPPERVHLASYALVNLAASYRINQHLEVFGRLDNLLDKRYQEGFGFAASRIAGFGGVRLEF